MAEQPSNDEIMVAIRKSGYLMEQEVATTFERRGFHVQTNAAFEDPDQNKSREIDVTAIERIAYNEKAKMAAFVELIMECKNSSNPFVFIARPKNSVDRLARPQEFMFPYKYQMRKDMGGGKNLLREVPAFNHLGFDKVFSEHQNTSKAVQFCRIDRKGKGWHANHGGLYDAMFYPMAKALAAKRKNVPRNQSADDWGYFWLFFPLIVTSGDLFVIDSEDEKPEPHSVDHITFVRELKSGDLSGSFMLTFVQQKSLSSFVDTVVDPVAELTKELVDNRLSFVKNTELPWVD